jgi:hypothetical protein
MSDPALAPAPPPVPSSAPPPVPLIDSRTAPDIAAQVQGLIRDAYIVDRPGLIPVKGVGAALIGIFGRFAEIIIAHLNKVPEKNLLAFMDLLGASLLPPQPARVPLTFSLAAGSSADAGVPAGTQVAAPPAPGGSQPVIFETERELTVTAARLDALYVRDPAADRYADGSSLTGDAPGPALPAFEGKTPIEHLLYIGCSRLLGLPNITGITLAITFSAAPREEMALAWEVWNGAGWVDQPPQSDRTTGAVRSIGFGAIAPAPVTAVNEVSGRWLRARLTTPLAPAADQGPEPSQAGGAPLVDSIAVSAVVGATALSVEAAFANSSPVDLSKDFYPFGEKPKFGDSLYLAQSQAFAEGGAAITLTITLTNPKNAAADSPLPRTSAAGSPALSWEYWDGQSWRTLGTAVAGQDTQGTALSDTTQALTQSGSVTLKPFGPSGEATVNGTPNRWIRARLVSGDYGQEARYVEDAKTPSGYRLIAATFAPPSIRSITVDYHLQMTTQSPDHLFTYNDFTYAEVGSAPFPLFTPTADTRPTLYFGFMPDGALPNRPLSLYVDVPEIPYGTAPDHPSPAASPRLVWAMGGAADWVPLVVRDDTQALTISGIVEFLPPAGAAPRAVFGLWRCWLRARWESGDYRYRPTINRVLLNTAMAAQTESIVAEVLGSSNGDKSQTFQTTRSPVLAGQRLEVREAELPSLAEQAVIADEEGTDGIAILRDATGRPLEIWVRWHEVPDFYGAGPRSRHYVLNHLTGEVRFGDGLQGLIPPAGAGNLRMAAYATGGGVAGNQPAGAVNQLKTTIPFVDKVTSAVPATGGVDAETLDALLGRAPRAIRHRGRAVTPEDYEDLARLASPAVARARCVPLRDLVDDPLDERSAVPGAVSVIVVPRSDADRPQPDVILVERVQATLAAQSVPTATVIVVGPLYIRVDVTVRIALTSLDVADAVQGAAMHQLAAFLHPLTGGQNGAGWDFGREPHVSDLIALLAAVPGVDHIDSLSIGESVDPPTLDLAKVKNTGRFLVYSGEHRIELVFEGA